MAQKHITMLEDDIQGGEATETIRFAFEGAEYEIDVNDKNATKLRQAFGFYVDHARKTSGGRRQASTRGRGTTNASGVDSQAVRAWAASNGVELNARGRIPAAVVERYRAARN